MHFAHGVYVCVSELVLTTKRVKGKGKVHPRTGRAAPGRGWWGVEV